MLLWSRWFCRNCNAYLISLSLSHFLGPFILPFLSSGQETFGSSTTMSTSLIQFMNNNPNSCLVWHGDHWNHLPWHLNHITNGSCVISGRSGIRSAFHSSILIAVYCLKNPLTTASDSFYTCSSRALTALLLYGKCSMLIGAFLWLHHVVWIVGVWVASIWIQTNSEQTIVGRIDDVYTMEFYTTTPHFLQRPTRT